MIHERTDKLDFINLKTSVCQRHCQENKKIHRLVKKIFAKNTSNKGLLCKPYKEYLNVNNNLDDLAQSTECQPENPRVACSIPCQDTCLGCGPGAQQGACERQPHTDVSLSLFLPSFPSL